MSYRALATFLNRKLWYQLGKSIQDFLILSQSSKLIILKDKGDFWLLFGKGILKFFKKFHSYFWKNTLNPIPFLLISGIVKNEIFFVEDRISFFQRELFIAKENNFLWAGEILIWSIFVSSKPFLGWERKIYQFLYQFNLIKKRRKEDPLFQTLISFYISNLKNKKTSFKTSSDSFEFSSPKKLKPRKSLIQIEDWYRRIFKEEITANYAELKFFYEFFPLGKLITLRNFSNSDWEKKNWASDCHLARTNEKNLKYNSFFQKPIENFFPLFFADWRYRNLVLETTFFILNASEKKTTSRWSKIGKFLGFSWNKTELSLLNLSRNFNHGLKLNQNRQIVERNKKASLHGNKLKKTFLKKNLLFLEKFQKLSFLYQNLTKKRVLKKKKNNLKSSFF